MAVFQLPFAIKMDTQIGVSTVCHIPQQEYYNESKIFILKKMYCTGQNYSVYRKISNPQALFVLLKMG